MPISSELELYCPQCSAVRTCGQPAMIERLRSIGLLRRQAQPEPELVVELFRGSANRFACQICGRVGLVVRVAPETDWPTDRFCETCRTIILAERIELFPRATRCAACEAESQRAGFGAEDREFCPRCGEVLGLRLSKGSGISRYTLTCPKCKS